VRQAKHIVKTPLFNLGFLCDELAALLQPLRHTYFATRLSERLLQYKKELEKMGKSFSEEFECSVLTSASPEIRPSVLEIQSILWCHLSELDRALIQLVSEALEREFKIIQGQIAKRKSLIYYTHSIKNPPLEQELIVGILVDSSRAVESLEADRKLVLQARQKVEQYLPLLRPKRDPNIQIAGIRLVGVFFKQGIPKTTSIKLAYDFLKAADPERAPSSLHSFHVIINRILH
jgi:hypothetical protein